MKQVAEIEIKVIKSESPDVWPFFTLIGEIKNENLKFSGMGNSLKEAIESFVIMLNSNLHSYIRYKK